MQGQLRLKTFIGVSIFIHLLVLGSSLRFSVSEPKVKKKVLQLSFGSGTSRGGSSPKVTAASKVQKQNVSSTTSKTVVTQKVDQATTKESAIQRDSVVSGNGVGTGGEGSGTGYTSGSGAGINDTMVKYRGLIHQLINSKKKYPGLARRLNQEGTVLVRMKLNREGRLLNLEVVEESRFESLTKASVMAIREIKQFPQIPDEAGLEEISFTIPFEYKVAEGKI